MAQAPVRFGVIGVNHAHIFEMTEVLLSAGAELAAFYASEDDLAAEYSAKFPAAPRRPVASRDPRKRRYPAGRECRDPG